MTTLGLLSALLIKPAALSSVAFAMTAMMRRTRASARHAVWAAAIGAMLALPLLAVTLPDLRISSLDDGARRVSAATQRLRAPRVSPPATRRDEPSTVAALASSTGDIDDGVGERVRWVGLLVWALVASLLLARGVAAEVRVHRAARNARPTSDRLRRLGCRVARGYDLQSVELRVSELVASPVVVGIVRPVVLLSEAAESWHEADLEVMLVHELGHVARHDCFFNFCSAVAASIYWCNPLVRLAAKRLRLEAERSCDERVVSAGTDPGAYAELLLRVARAGRCAPEFSGAATAMSRARELESRLVRLLGTRGPYAPVSRRMATVLVVVGVLVTMPAAALTVSAADAPIVQAMLPEPDRLADSIAAPSSERVPLRIDAGELDRRATEALAGDDSVLARRLLAASRHTPTHEGDLVGERASWALTRVTNGRLVEPLLESLDDRDWRIQAYAAWALAVAGDARAIPQLTALLSHPVWRVRAMAAAALRESRDVRAFAAMRDALTDRAWQVRMVAVEYVAAVGGPDARDLIRARLDDRHVAVRNAAERAIRTL